MAPSFAVLVFPFLCALTIFYIICVECTHTLFKNMLSFKQVYEYPNNRMVTAAWMENGFTAGQSGITQGGKREYTYPPHSTA